MTIADYQLILLLTFSTILLMKERIVMLQDLKKFPKEYDASSIRTIATPSSFALKNLFYIQEAGHLKRLSGQHTRQRSSLDSYLMVAVYTGTGTLNYQSKTHKLQAGDCFWIHCKDKHSYQSSASEPWELQWIHFNGEHSSAYYDLFCAQQDIVFQPHNFEVYKSHLERIYHIATEKNSQVELLISNEITQLLTQCITLQKPNNKNDKLDHIRDYLENHYAENITLDFLSEKFFLSKYYLAREFKSKYDMTIVEYLIQQRITFAKQLLRFSSQNIGEIAISCGYSNANFFSRQFMKTEGMSPLEYRKAWN